MTATVPDFAHTEQAEHNRILKARKIARWLWERDLSFEDVLAAGEATRRAWARAAHVTPPSTMETWQAVHRALVAMEGFAEDHPDHPSVARPHAGERGRWLAAVEPEPAPEPAAVRAPVPLSVVPDEPPPPPVIEPPRDNADDVIPRGWAALAALGSVPRPDAKCALCGARAVGSVVGKSREEWRCAGHPPQPGEWGASLDWTPPDMDEHARWCPPGRRCYVARCPNFRLGARAPMSDSALHDERSAAKGKNRAPFHVRKAAADAENARKDAEKARRGLQ